MRPTSMLLVAALLLAPCLVQADISPHMSYQGVLRDAGGSPVPDGTYTVVFKIYDSEAGGTPLWLEGHTLTAESGVIEATLGSVQPLTVLAFDVPYWLGISISGEPELVPRTEFTTVPYAAHAGFADTVLEGDQDWTIDGDNVYREVGNVGIGTAVTERKLDVRGGDERLGRFWNSGTEYRFPFEARNDSGTAGAFFGGSQGSYYPALPAALYARAVAGYRGAHISSDDEAALFAQSSNDVAIYATTSSGNVAWFTGGPVVVDDRLQTAEFKMFPGAVPGYVLTCDLNGVGTWQPVAGGGDSDWTISGSDMYSAPTGNVGVGYSTPSAKLHIQNTLSGEALYAGHTGSPSRTVTIDRATAASSGNDILQIGTAAGSSDGCQLIEAERGGSPVFQVYGDGNIVGASGASLSGNVEVDGGQLLVDFHGNDVGRFTSSFPATGAHVIHAECPDTGVQEDGIAVYGLYEQAIDYGIGGRFDGGYIGAMGVANNSGGTLEHIGVRAEASGSSFYNYGIYASASGGIPLAGYFSGDVEISGSLSASSKSFKIDHPLDPAGKYLYHASVESDEMMNVYSGNVTLDGRGTAEVELPEWFEEVNTDFRYQLTAIGAPGPNLYISSRISGNAFAIAGGDPGMEVSWQVTCVRHDPYSEANRMVVEVDKPDFEVGRYVHPELYGMPETSAVSYRVERGAAKEAERTALTPRPAFDPNDGE